MNIPWVYLRRSRRGETRGEEDGLETAPARGGRRIPAPLLSSASAES